MVGVMVSICTKLGRRTNLGHRYCPRAKYHHRSIPHALLLFLSYKGLRHMHASVGPQNNCLKRSKHYQLETGWFAMQLIYPTSSVRTCAETQLISVNVLQIGALSEEETSDRREASSFFSASEEGRSGVITWCFPIMQRLWCCQMIWNWDIPLIDFMILRRVLPSGVSTSSNSIELRSRKSMPLFTTLLA